MSTITEILSKDSECRYNGITDDLHLIKTLVSDKTLDYDLPTIVNQRFDYNKSIKLCNNVQNFKNIFYKKYPILVGLNMKNLLIAGGSVSDIIRERKYNSNSNDIDFFVYGLSIKDANERVATWIADVITCAKKHIDKKENKKENPNNKDESSNDDSDKSDESEESDPDGSGGSEGSDNLDDSNISKPIKNKSTIDYESKLDCELIRNNNTLLIKICGIKLQLIFRLYKTKSEILHGFDLGSSAAGFDGKQVYLTTLGKFCHEHSCNIIDTTRRSTTYEYRLEKYFDRDFNIVLPKLNIDRLKTQYFKYRLPEVCILPHFVFSYTEITGNKIILKDFYNKYSTTSDYTLDDIDEYKSFSVNIYNLVNDIDFFYYTSQSINTDNHEILSKPPRITKGSVISFYETLKKKIDSKKIDVVSLKKFVTVDKITDIVTNLIKSTNSDYIDDLISRQTDIVLKKLSKLTKRDHTKIKWIEQNPGTQISGSFNPIIADEKDWYGTYFVK